MHGVNDFSSSYTICLSNKKIYVAKRAIRSVSNQQSSSPNTATAQAEIKSPSSAELTGQQTTNERVAIA